MATNEQDLRLRLFNSLLTTPHRDLASLYPTHQEVIIQDPRFYVQMAAWYADNGEVRDHKEMFVVNLVLSDFPGHRDVGLALLRGMPPYQVGRVVDYVKGRAVRRRARAGEAPAPAAANQAQPESAEGSKAKWVIEKRGLFRNVPRSMVTEITHYLREREANPDWFDGSVLQARAAIKRLYASLHITPSGRAQAVLFDDAPPPDSRLYALKLIARAQTPAEQARAIVENRIPYRVAASVITQMTPMVLVALIESMSPQELINNLASLKQRGAFDNPEIKALIEGKLEAARSDERVSAYKAQVAAAAAGVSEDMAEKLQAVTQAQVKAKGRIVRPTALLIDKSGSMSEAIEIGKHIGAMVAGICEAPLYVYAFDSLGYPIEVPGRSGKTRDKRGPAADSAEPTLADWEKAMAGISAGGQTSCGVAVEMMRRQREVVEQIIMVTDEGENTAPYFVRALSAYREALKADPSVLFVKTTGSADLLERQCQGERILCEAYQFGGDYYALPNLLPILTRPSRLDLLMEIMAYPLPVRKVA